MKATVIKDRLQVLLATGALTMSLMSAAHARVPPRPQIEADAPAATEASDEAGPRIEKRIIVTTGEADSDGPVVKQERRVIIRTEGAGDAEDTDGAEMRKEGDKVVLTYYRGGNKQNTTATLGKTKKSRHDSVRTIVRTDDTGTYVIVANPTKRLTALDKGGKPLFEGEIETSEQQEKVPKDVWKKVQPMIEQLNLARDDAPATAEPAPKKTSALPAGKRRYHSSHMVADLHTYAAIMQYLLEPEYPLPAPLGTNRLAGSTGAASARG